MISTVLAATRASTLHANHQTTMSDDELQNWMNFPETRSRSSSISNTSSGSGSKSIVPVGRIIHRVSLPGDYNTSGRELSKWRSNENRHDRMRSSQSLVPVDDHDVPYFSPDTKHTASLHRVSNVYQELNTERAWLVTENDKVTRQKRMVIEELRDLELTLKQLMERKGALQKGLVTLQSKEDSTVTQIEALDKKIGLIGEKSVEFEELVRGIAGTPQYELGPDLEALNRGDSETGMCLRVLEGHTAAVTGLVGTGDGSTQLHSVGYDGTLRSWDASMFTCSDVLSSVGEAPLSCISVHEGLAAVGDEEGAVVLWDLQAKNEMHRKQCHRSRVECVQLQGDCFFTGSSDYTAQVWSLPNSTCRQKLEGHTGAVTCLMARPLETDRFALTTGSADGTVKLWDTRQESCHRTWEVDSSGVTGLILDDGRVYTTDARGTIKVWDLRAGSLMSSLNVGSALTSVTKSGEGASAVIVAGSRCGSIHVCSIAGDILRPMPSKLEAHTGEVTAVWSRGSTVWSGGADKTVRMWRLPDCASAQWQADRSNGTLQTNFFGI